MIKISNKNRCQLHFHGINSGFSFTQVLIFQDPLVQYMYRLCRRAYYRQKFRRLA